MGSPYCLRSILCRHSQEGFTCVQHSGIIYCIVPTLIYHMYSASERPLTVHSVLALSEVKICYYQNLEDINEILHRNFLPKGVLCTVIFKRATANHRHFSLNNIDTTDVYNVYAVYNEQNK